MASVTPLFTARPHVFWGEMWPCTHMVQVYGDDHVFLDALESFVTGALKADEAAIVIATAGHLHALEQRMREHGVDVKAAKAENRYIDGLAEEVLDEFMVDGWPDEALFAATVRRFIERARGETRRPVRAFGEMVAILWARGDFAATIQLEMLWTKLCETQRFPLFCAYPRDGFAKNAVESIVEICRAHARVIP